MKRIDFNQGEHEFKYSLYLGKVAFFLGEDDIPRICCPAKAAYLRANHPAQLIIRTPELDAQEAEMLTLWNERIIPCFEEVMDQEYSPVGPQGFYYGEYWYTAQNNYWGMEICHAPGQGAAEIFGVHHHYHESFSQAMDEKDTGQWTRVCLENKHYKFMGTANFDWMLLIK